MRPPESPQNGKRRPASFSVEEESAARNETLPVPRRSPRSFEDGVVATPDEQDPFVTPPELAAEAIPVAEPRARKKFSFVNLATAAFGTFLSLAFGLWADSVIRDLFSRADWLGYAALTALAVGLVAVAVIVGREIFGMMRLSAVQTLKAQAEEAALSLALPLPASSSPRSPRSSVTGRRPPRVAPTSTRRKTRSSTARSSSNWPNGNSWRRSTARPARSFSDRPNVSRSSPPSARAPSSISPMCYSK